MAADAAARGFQDNEVWIWLLANARTRARVERRTYRSQVKRVFVKRKSGWTTRGGTGTALWFPPGTKKMTLSESLGEALAFMPEGLIRVGKARRLEAAMEAHMPKEPHWYLSLLSVEPESQGKGHGSALIKPGSKPPTGRGSAATWRHSVNRTSRSIGGSVSN